MEYQKMKEASDVAAERGRYTIEAAIEGIAQRCHPADRGERNQGGDQTIFDRGSTLVIKYGVSNFTHANLQI